MSRTPILCYHNVEQAPDGSRFKLLYVSPEQFDRQLWTLRRLGMRGVSMRDGWQQLSGTARGNRVVLTFDDGYLDTLTQALPALRRYGFTATCYVVSGAIGTHNRWDAEYLLEEKLLMSHAHLQQWLAAGMEIGSHSCSHPKLQELDDASAGREIADSRAALRDAFGVSVEHFSYPFGRFSGSTVELVKRAGYASAVSLLPRSARATDDPHRLPRILVNGDQGWCRFLLHVATPYLDLRHRRRSAN